MGKDTEKDLNTTDVENLNKSETAVEPVDEVLPVDGSSNTFIPLFKVDEKRQEVWGYASVEEPDQADEIMDYPTSKPHFENWSQKCQKRSGGKSLGNLRGMHGDVAAGKLVAFKSDDPKRGFFIGAHVVDPVEWQKVLSGVYTGFSVGGNYVKRWRDHRDPSKIRYTAKPFEISLVDAPCVKSATFQVIKADGMQETRKFAPGDGTNVLKAEFPESPEPAGDIETGMKDIQVEKLPEQDTSMQIDPDAIPDSETLADNHKGVAEFEGDVLDMTLSNTSVAKKLRETADALEKLAKADGGESTEEKPEPETEPKPEPEEKPEPDEEVKKAVKVKRPEPRLVKVFKPEPRLVKVNRPVKA